MEQNEHKESIKLDEIFKMLFEVSDPLVIRLVNYFFDESFDENQDYDISFENTESVDGKLELLRADKLIQFGEVPSFHFEFQLNHAKGMVLRMFDYGYQEAKKHVCEEEGIKTICFPKQVVLYLEEGKGSSEDLKLRVLFPTTEEGEQSILYKVPVRRAWEIDKEEKIEKGLYNLLPLELFKLRRQIERTKTADEEEFSRLSKEIKADTMEVMETATKVWDEKRITEEDYRKIMEATTYLLGYFSRNYADLKLSKEVSEVMESFYYKAKDEGRQEGRQEGRKEGRQEGRQEGKQEGRRERNLQTAQKMLRKGLSLDLICEITELPRETVERLRKEIAN